MTSVRSDDPEDVNVSVAQLARVDMGCRIRALLDAATHDPILFQGDGGGAGHCAQVGDGKFATCKAVSRAAPRHETSEMQGVLV